MLGVQRTPVLQQLVCAFQKEWEQILREIIHHIISTCPGVVPNASMLAVQGPDTDPICI